MSRVLVLGGSRFFGKQLVELLLQEGHSVTIGTRGTTPDPFGDQVERIKLDRENRESLLSATSGRSWDLVYDNIAYSPRSALDACEAFAGKIGRYIFTSTLSVYEMNGTVHPEADFNPYDYPFEADASREKLTYGEGKRQAEAVLFQKASFPVCAVRLPIVMGPDDYTGRLLFHIEHVAKGEPMGIPNLDARMSYINQQEAAQFLYWLGFSQHEGPFNAAALGDWSLAELLRTIEAAVGKQAVVVQESDKEHASPYGVPVSWLMDMSKGEQAGFTFTSLDSWLPKLIQTLAAKTA